MIEDRNVEIEYPKEFVKEESRITVSLEQEMKIDDVKKKQGRGSYTSISLSYNEGKVLRNLLNSFYARNEK